VRPYPLWERKPIITADQTVVHIGENSPEYVALQLLRTIAGIENKPLNSSSGVDRKWVLDTFAECLNAVQNPTGRLSSNIRNR
jgi:hypothetical protein